MSLNAIHERPADDPRLLAVARSQRYPLLFATIGGAHQYGFPSPDSDFDIRGAHLLPVREVVGLLDAPETLQFTRLDGGLELDLVTHDLKKFCELLLKKNGSMLEQLYSPLVLVTSPEHAELREIARACMTRHHIHHYLGLAESQWRLFQRETPRRVKPLLYVLRALLTGVHLMRTGEVEAHLLRLNELYPLPYVPDLIARKRSGPEQATLAEADLPFYEAEYQRLCDELRAASERSALPDYPTGKPALHELLVRVRLATVGA